MKRGLNLGMSMPGITAGRRCGVWSVSLRLRQAPEENALLRAAGRVLHVDDEDRLAAYWAFCAHESPPQHAALSSRDASPASDAGRDADQPPTDGADPASHRHCLEASSGPCGAA